MLNAMTPTPLLCISCNNQTLVGSCDNQDRIGRIRHARNNSQDARLPTGVGEQVVRGQISKICGQRRRCRIGPLRCTPLHPRRQSSTAFQALHPTWPKHTDELFSFLLYSFCLHEVVETQCVDQAVLVDSKGGSPPSKRQSSLDHVPTGRAIIPSFFHICVCFMQSRIARCSPMQRRYTLQSDQEHDCYPRRTS